MWCQNETFDAEMESLANNNKKKNKLPPRHSHLEESIVRHKAHVTRLEQMLRLLDNEVSTNPPHSRQCSDRPAVLLGGRTVSATPIRHRMLVIWSIEEFELLGE